MKNKIATILLIILTSNLYSQNSELIKLRNRDVIIENTLPEERKESYLILHFDSLPSISTLNDLKIKSLNYINNKTIFAFIPIEIKLSEIDNLKYACPLLPEDKYYKSLVDSYKETNASLPILIYLPNDFGEKETKEFCERNNILNKKVSFLPSSIVFTELNYNKMSLISQDEHVSFIIKSPESISSNDEFHFCLGGKNEYGYIAEFAEQDEQFSTEWERDENDCLRLTYHFVNGTLDIPADGEETEVKRAFHEWSSYASIVFSETESPKLNRSIDILWDEEFKNSSPTAVAYAYYPHPHASEPDAGDIVFDDNQNWETIPSSTTRVLTYALHEIGHSLGLGHSSNPSAIMDPRPAGDKLHQDDIDRIQALYPEGDCYPNNNDRILIGNVTGNSDKEIIHINSDYIGGAIRVDDLFTGNLLRWYHHAWFYPSGPFNTEYFTGWMDNTDEVFLADVNGNGFKEIVFVNTNIYGSENAILVIDLSTIPSGNSIPIISEIPHGTFGGWMDNTDEMFFSDVNGDGTEDLILINTGYSGGAIKVIDVLTGSVIKLINHGTFNGWMDPADKMLMGDVNGDNIKDLILVNTSYSGGAVRSIDIMNNINLGWLNHTGTYNGWMDNTDAMAMGDVNGDNIDDLILINTGYTGGAIRSLDPITGTNYSWINHTGTFNGWMDGCDRIFVSDVNNDNKDDIVLVNSSYTGGAVRSDDITTGTTLSYLNHSNLGGWLDSQDRLFNEDVNGDNKSELIFVNTSYTGGAIRTKNVRSAFDLSILNHGPYSNWMDGQDYYSNTCNTHQVIRSANPSPESSPIKKSVLDISVYPNPATNSINFFISNEISESTNIKIIDAIGKVVINNINLNQGENKVNTNHLTSGIYFMLIFNDESIERIKFQISK